MGCACRNVVTDSVRLTISEIWGGESLSLSTVAKIRICQQVLSFSQHELYNHSKADEPPPP